ncbi:hypothetical protein [Actinophytocola sp.]|jgi:hypothetical protein|uniref:hypothetical protein n=1 Tax=Actinophytocola sp. TaxID=1872138 RepID=UPI002EDB3F1D
MNSAETDHGIESELIDLGTIPFRELRTLDSSSLHQAVQHVVDRTSQVRILSRSGNNGGGERVD